MSFFSAIWVLNYREWVRFLRSPGRIIGAIGAPLFFWFLLGSGMGSSFQSSPFSRNGYLEYFYPGMLAMVVLFTAIFASISLIEDRREGFLQMVLVTKVPRLAVVGGKVLGATTLAAAQAGILLALGPLVGISIGLPAVLTAAVVLLAMSLTLGSLGFLCAWRFNSVQSFHSVMNLLLFPMWLLSGALFPSEGASRWMTYLMTLNPLTYGVEALRQALYSVAPERGHGLGCNLTVLLGFGAVFLAASVYLVTRNRTKHA